MVAHLVIEGRDRWGLSSVLIVFSVFLALGASAIASVSPFPWLREGGAALVCVGTLVVGVGASFGLWRRSVARSARVVLDQCVEVSRGPFHHESFEWQELAGYRDGETDYIELVRAPGARAPTAFPRLTIPTLSEKDRVAVLELLDRRGLRRLE